MVQPKSTAKSDIVLIRRERVASLVARGLTQREITQALAKPMDEGGLRNPDTGQPYDLMTINRDLQQLRQDNRERAAENMDAHAARQYAELREIKRQAWSQRDPELALKALAQEMKLLGTMRQPDGINIHLLVVVQRFEKVATALNLDPTEALDSFVNVLEARRLNAGHSSGGE